MDKLQIENEIKRLSPFHHDIELPYGLRTCPSELVRREEQKTRVQTLTQHCFPPLLKRFGGTLKGKRILDLACNCGGFSFKALQFGADYVLGIDIVDRYIEQGRFIGKVLGLENIHFERMDMSDISPSKIGVFDVVLCFGILYHLEDIVGMMRKVATVCLDCLVVDTDTLATGVDPILRMNVAPKYDDTSGALASTALWRTEEMMQFIPSRQAVDILLRFLGFKKVEMLRPNPALVEPRYRDGVRTTFIASRHLDL